MTRSDVEKWSSTFYHLEKNDHIETEELFFFFSLRFFLVVTREKEGDEMYTDENGLWQALTQGIPFQIDPSLTTLKLAGSLLFLLLGMTSGGGMFLQSFLLGLHE